MTTWFRSATKGVTYVRCDLPARHLPGRVVDFVELTENNRDGTYTFRHEDDCSVWFAPGNHLRGVAMEGQKQNGQRVLVEVDDLYLLLAPRAYAGQDRAWVQKHTNTEIHVHSVQMHELICRELADGFIVSTPRLEQEYRVFGKPVFVCPNTVDPVDWKYRKPKRDVFRIGFAGSASHMIDMPLVVPALEWAAAQDGVEVVLMGSLDLPFARRVPWTDTLADYRKSLFQLDVGLCPLKAGRWSDCKSDLKALEYSMAGALPIVSRVKPYSPWLKHDTPALTADNPRDFLKQVKWCVRNQDEVRERAAACKAKVLAKRTTAGNIWRWREATEGGNS